MKATEIISRLYPNLPASEASPNADNATLFKDENKYRQFQSRDIEGIRIAVPEEDRDAIVHTLQETLQQDYVVYFSEQNFGHGPDVVTVLQSADRYDALRFEGCNGINYDIYTDDIIAHLEALEKEHPFVLKGVGVDFLQGDFLTVPDDVETLAQYMYEFCPDIVDQGTGTVEELANEIKNTGSFYYWWD